MADKVKGILLREEVFEALDAVGLRPVAMLHVYGRDD